jgi:type I restriction enzyme, S subunit
MKRWPTKLLGEICHTTSGGTPSRGTSLYFDGNIPWVKSGELKDGVIDDVEESITQAGLDNSSAKLFPKGTLLIALYGATVGQLGFLGCDAATNQAVCAIFPDNNQLQNRFLFYFLLGKRNALVAWSFGGGQPNISQATVRNLFVPVPPLAEQERIVKLLDEADELRKLRAQADRRTAEFIPALFHKMFGDNKFKLTRIADLTSMVTSGSTPRGGDEVYLREGPYFIRSQNVQMNWLDLSDAVCLPAEIHQEMARTKVLVGDVLLNITGASIGRVTSVDSLDREANVSQHVCLIRPKADLVTPEYLSVFISLPPAQQFIMQVQAGASRQALNHQQVRAMEIPLPPLPLQKEFAQRVTEIRELEAGQAASRRRLEELFQSLLHRAFNGEL